MDETEKLEKAGKDFIAQRARKLQGRTDASAMTPRERRRIKEDPEPGESPDEAARREIAALVAKLRGLSPNGKIPARWKNILLRAIAPPPSPRGRKISPSKYADIAKDIADWLIERSAASAGGRPARGINASRDRTILTAAFKRALSEKHRVSTRTIESVALAVRRAFEEGKPVSPDTLRAIIDGIAQALGPHITSS